MQTTPQSIKASIQFANLALFPVLGNDHLAFSMYCKIGFVVCVKDNLLKVEYI